jgi:hypothetical protein
MTARREVELVIKVTGSTAEIVTILTLLNVHGIRVLTQNCHSDSGGLVFLITTNQPESAHTILRDAGYACEERPVVLVGPSRQSPRLAVRVGCELQEHRIQVLYSYVSTDDEQHAYIVLKTSDDEDALNWLSRREA